MNCVLRQLLPPGSTDIPIEIYLEEDEVCVGRRTKRILSRFPQISRDHAIFYKSDSGTFFVKDNSSLNGIFVNDVKIGKSLKSLTVGDVIGFGVASCQMAEGFVCTVHFEPLYKVKHEVIEISDGDDDPPQTDVKISPFLDASQSIKDNKSSLPVLGVACSSNLSNKNSISKSKNSLIAKVWSGSESSSMNDNEPSRKSSNATCVIPIVSNVKHDTVKNPEFFNLPSTSKQKATARKSISSLKRSFLQSSRTSSDSSSNEEIKCNSRKRQKTVAVSKSQIVPSVSHPTNKKVKDFLEKTSERWRVPLIKCDSKNFPWPDDVKNPFSDSHNPSSSMNNRRHKKETRNKSYNLSSKKRNSSEEKTNFGNSKNKVDDEMEHINERKCPSLNFKGVDNKPSDNVNEKSTKNNKSDSESDNEISYSQVEDIIYISDDDDDDLNFKSSQDYIHIKQEPEEIEYHHEVDVGFENELDDLLAVNKMDNFAVLNQKNDHEIRTSEPVAVLGEKTQLDKMELEESDHSSDTDKSDHDSDAEESKHDSDAKESDHDSDAKESDHDSDAEIEKHKYVTRHPHSSDEKSNSNNSKVKSYSKEKFHIESNQNFAKEELTVVGSIRNKMKDSSKVQLIDAQPLEYRPRYMRGRDERVVERPKPVPPASAKKPIKSSKQQSVKETSLPKSILKHYKIPRKATKVNTDSCAEGSKHDQTLKKDSVSKKVSFEKKAPSVKTRPDKFASRMQFLTEALPVNPRKLTPAKNKSKKNAADSVAKTKQSSSLQQSKISDTSNQRLDNVPRNNVPVAVVSSYKPFVPQMSRENLHNPRDPRQNRQTASSSDLLKSDAGPSRLLVPITFHSSSNVGAQLNQTASTSQDRRFFRYQPNNSTAFELSNKLVKDILKLNTKWLEEQTKMKKPPDPVSAGAYNLPLKFDSFESYVSAFYPMIMLEMWEHLYTESKEVFESKKHYKKFLFSVLSYTSKNDYIELECESVVCDKMCFSPQEGSIAILEMKENAHKCSPMFGYIYKSRASELDLKKLKYPDWVKVFERSGMKDSMNNAKHLTFFAHIKKKGASFELGSLMKGNGLCYIRNKLRLVDALGFLQKSPLMENFLQPKWQTFLVNFSPAVPVREYNSGQIELINGVSAEICKPADESKIMLLQGPPGTGKTHTIIGLIDRLLLKNRYHPSFKILITAPSNAAVDEIACRLIAFNENAKFDKCIKFARVGLEEQVHPKVKPYIIDRLAKTLSDSSSRAVSNQNDRQLQNLRAEISKLENQMHSNHRNEKLSYLREQYNRISSSALSSKSSYHSDMAQKETILKECHIVISTLSSCGINLLLRTFKPPSKTQFSCCIIDESTQCTELEILQPLMLGVRKLLLVGDHKQLPATVLSKLACKLGFERSAFERFHLYFEKYCKKTPMFTLTEQFRMHSAICEFPSKFIYDHKLITNPNIDVRYEDFPLIPYMVLDIYVGQEKDDSSSKKNSTEAQVIINVCTILLDLSLPASSIGIITPYQAQRSLYAKALNVNPRYKDIEVNTVDGFQGREKDIIIMSSVRANSQGSLGFLACKRRLNVAITRAKKCLIVCGHVDSLMTNPDWRELILDAKKRNVCFHVNCPEDIPLLLREYMRKKRSMMKT